MSTTATDMRITPLAVTHPSPPPEELGLSAMTLDDLAEGIERQQAILVQTSRTMLESAITAGHLLIEAKIRVGNGFEAWCTEHVDLAKSTINNFIRLATHEDVVLRGLESGALERGERGGSVTRAIVYLRGQPNSDGSKARYAYPQAVRDEAARLEREGVPRPDIAKTLDVSRAVVHKWLSPSSKAARGKSRARAKAARAALRREERDRAMQRRGGSVAECNSLIKKLAQELDRTCAGETDKTKRKQLTESLTALYAIEDKIVHALGIE